MHALIHSYIHTCLHACIHSFMRSIFSSNEKALRPHIKSFAWKSAPNKSELSKEVDHKVWRPLNGLRSLIWRPLNGVRSLIWRPIIYLFFFTLKSGARTILYSSDNHPNACFWTYDKKINRTSTSIYTDLFPFMEQVFLQNHKFDLIHRNLYVFQADN